MAYKKNVKNHIVPLKNHPSAVAKGLKTAIKTCTKCGIDKHGESFGYRRVGDSVYLQSSCKECRKSAKNIERESAEKRLIDSVNKRARLHGITCDISIDDIVIPVRCPVLGISISTDRGKRTEFSPSVDRVDNTKGYTKDNVRIISWRANRLKGAMTPSEIKALYDYVSC